MLKVLITDTDTGEVFLDKEVRAIEAVYTTAEDVSICAVGDSTILEAAYRLTRFDERYRRRVLSKTSTAEAFR